MPCSSSSNSNDMIGGETVFRHELSTLFPTPMQHVDNEDVESDEEGRYMVLMTFEPIFDALKPF